MATNTITVLPEKVDLPSADDLILIRDTLDLTDSVDGTSKKIKYGTIETFIEDHITAALDVDTKLATKVDKVAGYGLSQEDFTTVLKNKVDGIEAGAQVNTVTSVNTQTGAVVLDKGDVGLGNVDNTSDLGKPISTATQTALDLKVDKVAGYGLSEEDFTTVLKNKLDGIESGAQVNVATNLGQSRNATTYTVTSSTGTDTTLVAATGTDAGVQSAADKTKLDGIASGAEVNVPTNLGVTGTGNTRTVTSSTGTDVTIPVATTSLAGWLSTGDKTKLDGIAAGAQVNTVTSVAGKTGAVTLVKGDVGLGNVDNTTDLNKPISTATQTALDLKVDDSQLSTTPTADKVVQANSNGYIDPDWLFEPSILSTLVSKFTHNEHKLYEPFGLEPKQLADVWTTTRASTATYVDPMGTIKTSAVDTPRIQFDPETGVAQGLLSESQRTNLLLHSEAFDNAAWLKSAPYSVVANTHAAPDGSSTADSIIVADGSGSFSANVVRQVISKAASPVQYTRSIFGKLLGATTSIRLVDFGATTSHGASVIVSLIDGSVVTSATTFGDFSNASASVVNMPDGWFRVSLTYTTDSHSSVTIRTFPYLGANPLTGDGSSGLLLWGAQLEAAPNASSYIKTEASAVTRSADNISRTLGDEFNQLEGTVYWEGYSPVENATNDYMWSMGDGSPSNFLGLIRRPSGAVRMSQNGGASITSSAFPEFIKAAIVYVKDGSVSLYVNGVNVGSTAFTSNPSNYSHWFLSKVLAINYTNTTASADYYPRAVSSTEAQDLTRI